MAQLLTSPWTDHFQKLIRNAASSLVICSPYIGSKPCLSLKEVAASEKWSVGFQLLVLTDLSPQNMIDGITDVAALAEVAGFFPSTAVRFLPSLHAKVYIRDQAQAIVTSGNMTSAGLSRNLEYGVLFNDQAIVGRIKDDILKYAELGSPINFDELKNFAGIVDELRDLKVRAERRMNRRLRSEFEQRLKKTEGEVLRVRAGGRAPHTIFAEAIIYSLASGPLSTSAIHSRIQTIHPDLCDDAVDRIIEGYHFGKKWKHAVRTAQQHLKRRGKIELQNGKWHLVK